MDSRAAENGEGALRSCGECHLCCKVFPIPETGKEKYGNCPHLIPGQGCRDYEARPDTCRNFVCIWMQDPSLTEEWKPCHAGFVLHDPAPWSLLASVDVDDPDAWKREPYLTQLREWAREFAQGHHLVGVRVGANVRLLLRDGEVEIDG